MNWIRTGLASCVVALAIGTAAAQSGGLTVKVVDQDNDPLPGATVTISHNAGGVPTTSYVTKADGIVDFPVLRGGGGYSIRVSFPGFSEQVIDDIRIKIGETQVMPITVLPEITERVTVTAKRAVIDLEKATTSTKFSDNFIGDLPVPGRAYENILTLAPGVQDADGDGDPIVHGSRERDFRAEVGGVSNVDPLTGKRMSRVNLNTIEEIEVITAGAGVEFGRAQGGYARIVQKQGNNDHEGVFEFYFRSSALDGDGARDDSALPDPEADWFQPSVLFSGPIVRDRLWYRLSHDIRNIDRPINTGAGIVVQRERDRTHSDLLTWQVSPRNKLGMQFDADPSDTNNLGVSSARGPESAWRAKSKSKTYKVNWTAAHSPKVLVESVVSWQELNSAIVPSTVGVPNTCVEPGPATPNFLVDSQCNNNTTGLITGSFFRTVDDRSQRLTTRSDATFFGGRFWGMSHQFKLGMSVENERYFRRLDERPRGNATLVTFQEGGEGGQTLDAFLDTNFTVSIPQVDDVRATGTNWAIYAEDQFKPRQNLTITAGVRVSREEINSEGKAQFDPRAEFQSYLASRAAFPSESVSEVNRRTFTAYEDTANFIDSLVQLFCAGQNAAACRNAIEGSVGLGEASFLQKFRAADNISLVNTNFEPSLNIGWTPWSSGKTVFRASARRSYNQVPLTVPLQELEPATANLGYRVFFDGTLEPDGQVTPAVNVSVVSRDLKTPYSDEWTLTFEREMFTETSLRVQYINRKYRDQIQDIDINRDAGDFGRCQYMLNPNDQPLLRSPGAGFELVDPFTGETYIDTDPGDGDGRRDDCIGEIVRFEGAAGDGGGGQIGSRGDRLFRPDGVADLYVQNPYWGSIFEIGNYNEHDYQGLVMELTRRQYRGWELQGSYTLSKAKGNGEDFFQIIGDDPSLVDDEFGFQSSDQRHVVKVNATTVTPWGVRLGGSVSWQSGLPYSILLFKPSFTAKHPDLPSGFQPNSPRFAYPTGVRNDQRNASYWDVTLKATREFTLGRSMNLQVSAEVFNVLADDTYTIYNNDTDVGRQINGNNEGFFRFGREWQLGMKLAF